MNWYVRLRRDQQLGNGHREAGVVGAVLITCPGCFTNLHLG